MTGRSTFRQAKPVSRWARLVCCLGQVALLACGWLATPVAHAADGIGGVISYSGQLTGPIRVTASAGAPVPNRVLSLDGSSYVEIPNSTAYQPQQFTLALWCKPGAIANKRLLSNIKGYTPGGITFAARTDTGRFWFAISGSNSEDQIDAIAPYSVGTWYHLAGTYDGATLRFYVNGVLQGTRAYSGTVGSPHPLLFGAMRDAGGSIIEQFIGSIDEIQIWNRALNQSEIQNVKARALLPSEPNLVAYWSFNGTNFVDNTTNANNGTGIGAATTIQADIPSAILGTESQSIGSAIIAGPGAIARASKARWSIPSRCGPGCAGGRRWCSMKSIP